MVRPTKKAEVFLKVLRVKKRSCMRIRYVSYGDVMRGRGEGGIAGIGFWGYLPDMPRRQGQFPLT